MFFPLPMTVTRPNLEDYPEKTLWMAEAEETKGAIDGKLAEGPVQDAGISETKKEEEKRPLADLSPNELLLRGNFKVRERFWKSPQQRLLCDAFC